MKLMKQRLESLEPELKEILKRIDPDKYIELGFNDFENA